MERRTASKKCWNQINVFLSDLSTEGNESFYIRRHSAVLLSIIFFSRFYTSTCLFIPRAFYPGVVKCCEEKNLFICVYLFEIKIACNLQRSCISDDLFFAPTAWASTPPPPPPRHAGNIFDSLKLRFRRVADFSDGRSSGKLDSLGLCNIIPHYLIRSQMICSQGKRTSSRQK